MTLRDFKYTGLLIAQCLLMTLAPFFASAGRARWAFTLAVTALFATAIYSISRNRKKALIAVLLMLPALAGFWISHFRPEGPVERVVLISACMFFVYVAGVILLNIMSQRSVTADTIAGGIAVYLLIGIVWAFVYMLIEQTQPGAFRVLENTDVVQPLLDLGTAVYFSFVTLTTLGYGDIYPLTELARSAASFEAIFGQVYLVVLIARLVGLHISHYGGE